MTRVGTLRRILLSVAVLAAASLAIVHLWRSNTAGAVFDDSMVHDIRLSLNPASWQALTRNFRSNDYYQARFTWRGHVMTNVGIRSRGNGSRNGVKPGLRVDFDRDQPGQTFLGLKALVLRNNTQDPSNMHEWLAMAFFERMGLPAPREAFARLLVNDEYAGLYTVVEEINEEFLARTFGEDDGYLYEFDYNRTDTPYFFESRGTDPARYVPKPFSPETRQDAAQPEVIARMVHAIAETSADEFRSAVAPFVDLPQFVRHVAVEAFLADQDGIVGNWGMNNFYMYRAPAATRFTFIPWDKSQAFGDGAFASVWRNLEGVPAEARNRLMGRAIEYPDLRDEYLSVLLEASRVAREPPFLRLPGDRRGWLERQVDRMHQQIDDAVRADTKRPYSNEQFDVAVRELRAFARNRPPFVDNEVAASRSAPAP